MIPNKSDTVVLRQPKLTPDQADPAEEQLAPLVVQ
jgi:hypothetical protein